MSKPLAYFISFRTYGSWLRGDERGWQDRRNNKYGTPFGQPDEGLAVRDGEHPQGLGYQEAGRRGCLTRTQRSGRTMAALATCGRRSNSVGPAGTSLTNRTDWALYDGCAGAGKARR